jgi:hypothetical protein
MKALGISEPRRNELMERAQTAYDELNGDISTQHSPVKLRLLHNKILPEIKEAGFDVFKRELRISGAPRSFVSFAIKTVGAVYATSPTLPPLDGLKKSFLEYMEKERRFIIDRVRRNISLSSIGFCNGSKSVQNITSLVLERNKCWGSYILNEYGTHVFRDSVEHHVFKVLTVGDPIKCRFKVILPDDENSNKKISSLELF